MLKLKTYRQKDGRAGLMFFVGTEGNFVGAARLLAAFTFGLSAHAWLLFALGTPSRGRRPLANHGRRDGQAHVASGPVGVPLGRLLLLASELVV